MMETLDQGDLIIRPSSKGENHLTVTWKVRNREGVPTNEGTLEVQRDQTYTHLMCGGILTEGIPILSSDVLQVADGIYQHVDVREEGKENAFSLGHTLWINNEVRTHSGFCFQTVVAATGRVCFNSLQEFEDLDEITARFIQPMASFARDLLGHKYFQECNGGSKEVHDSHDVMNHILTRSCTFL